MKKLDNNVQYVVLEVQDDRDVIINKYLGLKDLKEQQRIHISLESLTKNSSFIYKHVSLKLYLH